MKNYDRYQNMTAELYEKKGVMFYLFRFPEDRKIIPLLSKIENKKILDVGLGTGYYTKLLIEKNKVVGIDQNPHLCKLPIPLYKGDATQLSQIVGNEKFDIVLSTGLIEYLNPEQLTCFLGEAKKVLNNGGIFMSTFISSWFLGYAFVKFSKMLKSIDKHCYSKKEIINKLKSLGFININVTNLSSWFHIPSSASLVLAER